MPQALMGVATVWLLYAAVKRVAGEAAALLAGVVLALTPVAVPMFRFNNPDALLVLLLTAGAYATVRAIDDGRMRWLVLAGACVGFGFLTKMLQAFLVLPAFGVAWLVGAQRNGFGRLTGDEVGSVGGGGTGGVWGRLFGAEMAGGIAWLYTVALAPALAGVAGIGAVALWRRGFTGVAALSGAMALTAMETYLLLESLVLLVLGLVAAALLLVVERSLAVAALAVVVALAGPAAYSAQTAAATHSGALPSAGPSAGRFGGGMGGLLDAPAPGADLVALLRDGAYTWTAATVGSNNAAGYQLASGKPVLAVGGFNGTDPAPTLTQLQAYVESGQIHYFIGDGAMSSTATGGSDAGARIAEWVAENYVAQQVSGVAVYDLS